MRSMKNSRNLLILLVCGALLGLPGIWTGVIFGHDTLSHLVMSRNFSTQFWLGDIYPRWLWQLNAGFGSPVFHYYGPVPFYVMACLKPLWSNDPEGWHQLAWAASLAMILSGFTAYAWLKNIAGKNAALVGSVLYMSAPYHLSIDFYQRFAFGELWSFVWMPLVLLFAQWTVQRRKYAAAGLATSYALLVMTHLPTTLLFSPVLLAYVLWNSERDEKILALARVSGSLLFGMGLSAIYLLPAMTEQGYVHLDVTNSAHFVFQNSFLAFQSSIFDGSKDFSLGMARNFVLAMMVTLGAWLLGRRNVDASSHKALQFWCALAVASFLMMLSPSKPVWQLLPVLEKIQFPWRLGILLTLAMVAVVTIWMSSSGSFRVSRNPVFVAIISLIFFIQLIPLFDSPWVPPHLKSAPSIAYFKGYFRDYFNHYFNEKNAALEAQIDAAQLERYSYFLPQWADANLFQNTSQSVRELEVFASSTPLAQIREGDGVIDLISWQPARIAFRVHSELGVLVVLHQFYFPGWVALMDGYDKRAAVTATDAEGLVAIRVPAGHHDITVERQSLPEEKLGQAISALSALLLIAQVFGSQRRSKTAPGKLGMPPDQATANAFASSWNHLPAGSIYTREQFEDWLAPITERDVRGKDVLELGCGNGSLMVHISNWNPMCLDGVDLGDSVSSAQENMSRQPFKSWQIHRADMIGYKGKNLYDLVYSIGVLHHLKHPKEGLDAVVANTKSGGRFHCWVYAREGNGLVMLLVEPIRKMASRCPWWFTKYCLATPLVAPYFVYAKAVRLLGHLSFIKAMPLYEYSLWISRRDFSFFRHVAFDQLVTPQTTYISESTLWNWLSTYDNLDRGSLYVVMRNGNSWKFGGVVK
jgi:SAM-dependent methyltransferase